jgi:hypothetical protein
MHNIMVIRFETSEVLLFATRGFNGADVEAGLETRGLTPV